MYHYLKTSFDMNKLLFLSVCYRKKQICFVHTITLVFEFLFPDCDYANLKMNSGVAKQYKCDSYLIPICKYSVSLFLGYS